jgi:hypothetical protein
VSSALPRATPGSASIRDKAIETAAEIPGSEADDLARTGLRTDESGGVAQWGIEVARKKYIFLEF